MYEYHTSRPRYFDHQCRVTAEHVIPFIELSGPIRPGARVLEIGCAEAGVLAAFLERGASAFGIDRNRGRLEKGREFLSTAIKDGRLELLEMDAADLGEQAQFRSFFDVIVMKDAIEHVDDRRALLASLRGLLAPGGRVFLAFPPWRMPFGGHQQICRSKILSRTPYVHMLPAPLYSRVLTAFGEKASRVESLLAIQRTRVDTLALERDVADLSYQIAGRRLYLLNPIYRYRFGVPPVEQSQVIARRGWLRDFMTTCAYYTLTPAAHAT